MSAQKSNTPPPSMPELTAVEWEVMKVVWKLNQCTAGDVQEAVEATHGWAYSTVKTTMDRMTRKGFLGVSRVRHMQLFEAQLSRREASHREVRKLLTRAFDGAVAPMMNHLVEHEALSRAELDALRRLIDDAQPADDPDVIE